MAVPITDQETPALAARKTELPAAASQVVLATTIAIGGFAALASATLLLKPPDAKVLATGLVQQSQGAKTLLYLLGFGLLPPLAAVAGIRVARAIGRGPSAAALPVLSALLAGGLAAVFVLARLSGALPRGGGLRTLLLGVALWAVLAAAALLRARRPWPALAALVPHRGRVEVAAAVATVAAVLCFTHLTAARLAVLGLAAVVVLVFAIFWPDVRLRPLRRRWGAAADVLVVVMVVLAVPDLVVFTTSTAIPTVFSSPGVIAFHHDFLLGPTNQVLNGGTLLVDNAPSQYGVGSVYFLAAWFQLAPIGYGTYALLDGLLTATYFAAAYGILRLAHAPRLLAAGGMAVAVVAFVLALAYPIGALPQQGPLRFGLPMALVLATVAGLSRPAWARGAEAAALVVVGVASVWALEGLVYTLMTLAALLAARACLRDGQRVRWLLGRAAAAFAACVVAHLLLAGATLIASGELPDWGEYLAYLREFLGGGTAGSLTYGFEPWSPGLVMGALYVTSTIGVGTLLLRAPRLARREPVLTVALAGLTADGIALFSYTQNRSSTYLMPYVALPALLVAVLWVVGALRTTSDVPRAVRRAGLVALAAAGLVLLASALPVGERLRRSALAHALPGGGLPQALSRLWHPPPIDPRAPEAQRLLDRHMPGQGHVLVLLPSSPDLLVETLMRSGRGNRLPIGDPVEESFVPSVRVPPLRRAIARLRANDRVLIDQQTVATLAQVRARPASDPLEERTIGEDALAKWVLKEIGRRFDLRPVARGSSGLMVAELVPR